MGIIQCSYHSAGSNDGDVSGILEFGYLAVVCLEDTVCECKSPDEGLHDEACGEEEPGVHSAIHGRERFAIVGIRQLSGIISFGGWSLLGVAGQRR